MHTIKKAIIHMLNVMVRHLDRFPRLKTKVKSAYLAVLRNQAKEGDVNYHTWALANYPNGAALYKQRQEILAFKQQPLISIITPVYNTDHEFLRSCIESVLAQSYEKWELFLVDDKSPDSKVRDILKEYEKRDARIHTIFNKKNMHISDASNVGIKKSKGEFVTLLDHDDIMWPHALFEVAKVINSQPDVDFIYSDEDKIDSNDFNFQNPFFKPDWNPDFLHSVNYITHLSVVRRKLLDKVGLFNSKYNGAQDWDLFLRITSETDKIVHIPKILYSWRISNSSTAKNTKTKPYVVEAQKNAILDDLKRKGHKNAKVMQKRENPNYWYVKYDTDSKPLISIVIPSKNAYKVLKRCITSIQSKTTYKNYEIIIVDTGSTDSKVKQYYKKLERTNVKTYSFIEDKFSYANSCNFGASKASGEYLVMLNNDTEVISKDWLEWMLGYASREGTGLVGCKLLYPKVELVQHAGIGIGLGGVAANLLTGLPEKRIQPMQHIYMHTVHNVSAVTAACVMVKKDLFDSVDGFDSSFRITYNDVDLSLRILEKGYLNVYIPNVKLYHYESYSLGKPKEKKRDNPEFDKAKKQFVKRWKKYVDNDPNFNPNFDKGSSVLKIQLELQKDR